MHALRPAARVTAILAVVVALLAAIPVASAAPLNLRVGAALSLTGDAAAYGISSKRGIDMAVAEINAGAVPGVHLDVRTLDDESTTAGAAMAFGVFFRDGRTAILGPTLSSVALDVDPFAQAARIPVVAVSNTQPGVTEIGSFIFRASLTEAYVLPRVVRTVARSTDAPKTAVVIQGSDAFAATSGPILSAALEQNGLTVLADEVVAPGRTVATIATETAAKRPDVVAISALAAEAVPLLRDLRAAGYLGPIIGSNGLNSAAVMKGAGAAANGLIVGTAWAPCRKATCTPASWRFMRAFGKRYGKKISPDQFAATAYAYTYVLATAAARGGTVTADGLQKALAEIRTGKSVRTVLGPFTFDAERNGRSPVLVRERRAGGWHPYTP